MKNVKKLCHILIITLILTSAATPQFVYAAPTICASPENNLTQTYAVLEWHYKMMNNVLHKRQYNTATHKWVGSWVPV